MLPHQICFRRYQQPTAIQLESYGVLYKTTGFSVGENKVGSVRPKPFGAKRQPSKNRFQAHTIRCSLI